MKEMLTYGQEQVYQFLRRFISEKGYPLTLTEIAKALKFKSPNAASDHLDAIAKKGFITRAPNLSRAIVLVEDENLKSMNEAQRKVSKRQWLATKERRRGAVK